MELRHLRYFVAICEAGSFSRAAGALHVTQPTLSHQIQQLEDELGTRLLHRLGRRTEPTAAGEVFRRHCVEALGVVEAGVTALHEIEGVLRGRLCVAVFHSFARSRLPAVFAEFASRHPGVHMVVRQISRDERERELLRGALDFAIGYTETDDPQIEAQPLSDEELVLVVSRRHPWAGLASVPMARIAEQGLILLTPEFGVRGYLDAYFESARVQPRVALEMNAIEPILAVIRDTEFATVLQQDAVGDPAQLHTIRLTDPTPRRQAAILWRRLGHRSPAALRLAGMIRDAHAAPAHR